MAGGGGCVALPPFDAFVLSQVLEKVRFTSRDAMFELLSAARDKEAELTQQLEVSTGGHGALCVRAATELVLCLRLVRLPFMQSATDPKERDELWDLLTRVRHYTHTTLMEGMNSYKNFDASSAGGAPHSQKARALAAKAAREEVERAILKPVHGPEVPGTFALSDFEPELPTVIEESRRTSFDSSLPRSTPPASPLALSADKAESIAEMARQRQAEEDPGSASRPNSAGEGAEAAEGSQGEAAADGKPRQKRLSRRSAILVDAICGAKTGKGRQARRSVKWDDLFSTFMTSEGEDLEAAHSQVLAQQSAMEEGEEGDAALAAAEEWEALEEWVEDGAGSLMPPASLMEDGSMEEMGLDGLPLRPQSSENSSNPSGTVPRRSLGASKKRELARARMIAAQYGYEVDEGDEAGMEELPEDKHEATDERDIEQSEEGVNEGEGAAAPHSGHTRGQGTDDKEGTNGNGMESEAQAVEATPARSEEAAEQRIPTPPRQGGRGKEGMTMTAAEPLPPFPSKAAAQGGKEGGSGMHGTDGPRSQGGPPSRGRGGRGRGSGRGGRGGGHSLRSVAPRRSQQPPPPQPKGSASLQQNRSRRPPPQRAQETEEAPLPQRRRGEATSPVVVPREIIDTADMLVENIPAPRLGEGRQKTLKETLAVSEMETQFMCSLT